MVNFVFEPAWSRDKISEDGIRDCLLSRGLGDVYKRQIELFLKDWEKVPGKPF